VSVLLLASASGDGYEAPGPSIFWQPWFGHGQWSFTRPMALFAIAAAVLIVWLLVSTRRQAVVPTRSQFFTEQVYGLVRNSVARDIIGSHDFLRFVPLLFAMFVLILLNNLFGVIPPVQYPTLSRIGFPIALTLVVYVTYHVVGIRRVGLGRYLKSMIPSGVPAWVLVLLIPLEYAQYFVIRPVTLSLRIFGNMFAGHILLVLLVSGGEYLVLHTGGSPLLIGSGIVSWIMGAVMYLFEALVEFLQAYIFVLLSALYIAGSLADEH
jgi:F-type H+-transporting ATPase subunit a